MRFPLSSGTKQSWKLSAQDKSSFNNRPGISDLKCQFSPLHLPPSFASFLWSLLISPVQPCPAMQGQLPCPSNSFSGSQDLGSSFQGTSFHDFKVNRRNFNPLSCKVMESLNPAAPTAWLGVH